MKKFDKGYIYSSLLSDFFSSLVFVLIFLKDLFLEEEATPEDVIQALPLFAIGFAVVYLGFIAYRILFYRTSGYELTDKEIKCKKGVLFRKNSVLDYRKIHAINKKQGLIQRVFGIAVLTVDSGSTNTSHQAEIVIIEKAKTVDALLNRLHGLKEDGVQASDASKEEVVLSHEDRLYRFTSKRKLLYSLINIASASFFTAVFGVLAILAIGACKLVLQLDGLGTWGQYFLFAGLITVGAMLLLSAFSFVGCMINSFVGYHKFTITKQGGDIQISYGLLERHTNTFSYDRIKAVKISQGLVQRMLGFAAIKLEVIGYTYDSGDDSNGEIGVLVPFCKYHEVEEILGKVLPDYIPDPKQTKAVSYFPFLSWFTFFLGVVTGTALLLAIALLMIFQAPSSVITAVALGVSGGFVAILAVKALHAAFS
jgi:putative membrane protein